MDTDRPGVTDASFLRTLANRVEDWLRTDEARAVPGAQLYRHLPEMYAFLVALALDPRLPERERAGVASALKYIVAPYDLIPEGLLGPAGYRDDLVLAAMVIDHLCAVAEPRLMATHWRLAGAPRDLARAVLDAATPLVGDAVYARLREWVPA